MSPRTTKATPNVIQFSSVLFISESPILNDGESSCWYVPKHRSTIFACALRFESQTGTSAASLVQTNSSHHTRLASIATALATAALATALIYAIAVEFISTWLTRGQGN